MDKKLNRKDRELIKELLLYAKSLSSDDLEHLVWISEGMRHATQTFSKEDK